MAEKTYKVVSKAPQFGHKHGETFKKEIPEGQEKRMIARGAIEVVSGQQQSQTPPPPPAGGPGGKKQD